MKEVFVNLKLDEDLLTQMAFGSITGVFNLKAILYAGFVYSNTKPNINEIAVFPIIDAIEEEEAVLYKEYGEPYIGVYSMVDNLDGTFDIFTIKRFKQLQKNMVQQPQPVLLVRVTYLRE